MGTVAMPTWEPAAASSCGGRAGPTPDHHSIARHKSPSAPVHVPRRAESIISTLHQLRPDGSQVQFASKKPMLLVPQAGGVLLPWVGPARSQMIDPETQMAWEGGGDYSQRLIQGQTSQTRCLTSCFARYPSAWNRHHKEQLYLEGPEGYRRSHGLLWV